MGTFGGYPVHFWVANLLCALLPSACAHALHRVAEGEPWDKLSGRRRVGLAVGGVLWALALPHALYFATLIHHLHRSYDPQAPLPLGDHGALVLLYAGTAGVGWLLFADALTRARRVAAQVWGPRVARVLPWVAVPLATLGALLGLVDRLDPWDVLLRPGAVLAAVARRAGSEAAADWLLASLVAGALHALHAWLQRDA